MAGALAAASLLLFPIMNTYRVVHDRYGLTRNLSEIKAFGATIESWFNAEPVLWLWGSLLNPGTANLFPGITGVALVAAGSLSLVRTQASRTRHQRSRRRIIQLLALAVVVSAVATLVSLIVGRWGTTIAGIPVRMSNANRAVLVLLACGAPLLWMTRPIREAFHRRSAAAFYAVMVPVIAILCFGPEVRGDGDPILSTSPYAWLMWLPGFDNLRVLTRFWAFGTLCLAVAAALAFARLVPRHSPRAPAVTVQPTVASVARIWYGACVDVQTLMRPEGSTLATHAMASR